MNKVKSTRHRIKTAIVGFGLSGRVFHAPFVNTNSKFQLHTIVTSGDEAKKLYPGVKISRDFKSIIENPAIGLVVICTPHHLHTEQACMALERGKHVVIEKPVAMSSTEIEQIISTSEKYGKMVFPYHNRRWDGDFMTIRHLIREGYLGEVLDFESHFDRYSPDVLRAEWRYNAPDGGGTLYDLAPHLIDQAIALFGKPQSVWCLLHNQREGSMVNDSFDLKLIYPKLTSTLQAGIFVKEQGPRFHVNGTLGSFIKYGLDTQEAALKAGKMPDSKNFGVDMKKNFGLLNSVAKGKSIRLKYATIPGYYKGFYDDVFAAINGQKSPEVTAEDALLNLQIIEAAIRSHEERKTVDL